MTYRAVALISPGANDAQDTLRVADDCGLATRMLAPRAVLTRHPVKTCSANAERVLTDRGALTSGTVIRTDTAVVVRSDAEVLTFEVGGDQLPADFWKLTAGDPASVDSQLQIDGNTLFLRDDCSGRHLPFGYVQARGLLAFGTGFALAIACPGSDGISILTEGMSVRTEIHDTTMLWRLNDGRVLTLQRPQQ